MSSDVLVAHCHDAGILVRNPVLASISLAEKEQLFEWIAGPKRSPTLNTAAELPPVNDALQREDVRTALRTTETDANELLEKLLDTISSLPLAAVEKRAILTPFRAFLASPDLQRFLHDDLQNALLMLDAQNESATTVKSNSQQTP